MNPYKKMLAGIRQIVAGTPHRMTFVADGFGVRKKFVPFLDDAKFDHAWRETTAMNDPHWEGKTPDIRWRCHVCAWAATCGSRLEGDFAEFGVNTGILSSMILKTTDVSAFGKKFFLFDTFEGIPEDMASEKELAHTRELNKRYYPTSILEETKAVFAPFENVEFIVGRLPETIKGSGIKKIAYASIDLNSVAAEMAVIEEIWDMMTPGAMIVLDDYGFAGHEEQNQAWNAFAAANGRMILAVPTGQGILMR